MVERVTTGIPGLDDLIEGGYPKNSIILIAGGTGTGKTIFCIQFLMEGLRNNEPGVYITLEEDVNDIKADAKQFGWDVEKYEKTKLFKLEYINPLEGRGFETRIEDLVESIGAKRLVIDSTSVIGVYTEHRGKIRERLYNLVRLLKKLKISVLLTAEIPENEPEALSRFGVEEFIADGVIVLSYLGIGSGIYRNLEIRKLRRTNHSKGTFPFEITKKGIIVYENEEAYLKEHSSAKALSLLDSSSAIKFFR